MPPDVYGIGLAKTKQSARSAMMVRLAEGTWRVICLRAASERETGYFSQVTSRGSGFVNKAKKSLICVG